MVNMFIWCIPGDIVRHRPGLDDVMTDPKRLPPPGFRGPSISASKPGCPLAILLLVGGFKHFLFSIIYGIMRNPLTFIFFRGVKTTNQLVLVMSESKIRYVEGLC
jgi:hypothetical protein